MSYKFFWPSMMKTMSEFTKACVHWIGSKDSKVAKPLGKAIHAPERNPVLHDDFSFIKKSESAMFPQELQVIRGDWSHEVKLCPAKSTDQLTVAESLMNWYKRCNVANIHVSDRGCHLKNSLISQLHFRLIIIHGCFFPSKQRNSRDS